MGVIGALIRAYQYSVISEDERSKQASSLRAQGKYLEASRLLDPLEQVIQVAGGPLVMRITDFTIKSLKMDWAKTFENDARFTYIVNKILAIDSLMSNGTGDDIGKSVGYVNHILKSLILHPPFKTGYHSHIVDYFGKGPEYALRLLYLLTANAYAYFLALRDCLNIKQHGLSETSSQKEEIAGIVELIDTKQLPWPKGEIWPVKGPRWWMNAHVLKLERLLVDREYDKYSDLLGGQAEVDKIYLMMASAFCLSAGQYDDDEVESIAEDNEDIPTDPLTWCKEYNTWRSRFYDDGAYYLKPIPATIMFSED